MPFQKIESKFNAKSLQSYLNLKLTKKNFGIWFLDMVIKLIHKIISKTFLKMSSINHYDFLNFAKSSKD